MHLFFYLSGLRRTGYELSQIESSYEALKDDGFTLEGWETSPFLIFVRTIPGRFYPIAMLCLQLLLILTKRDFGSMFKAEQRALQEKKLYADSADREQAWPRPHCCRILSWHLLHFHSLAFHFFPALAAVAY